MIRGDDETIRDRLKAYRSLVLKYEAYSMVYDQLYPRITPILSDKPRGQSDESELERIVQRRIDLSDKICGILQEMRDSLADIMDIISILPENEEILIILRYVKGMSWNAIERKMCYSHKQVFRIHNRAIEKMNLRARI